MSINTPAAPGPLPDGPPHRQAGPGAARAHVRRLHQDGRTYQAIATTAGLAPATVSDLATGRRRPTRGTTTAILAVTSATVPARPRRRRRHPAAAARPPRHGPRLGPHRPRPRRPRDRHQPARPRRRPHHQAEAARRGRRPVRRVVGQACPRPAPAPSAPPPPPPAARPSPGTGAPPPPSTTTSSTPPATGPDTAGNPPPAPGSPPTSARRPAAGGPARDQREPDHHWADLRHPDALERHGYYRGDDQHADRAIGLIGRPGPHLGGHPGPPR